MEGARTIVSGEWWVMSGECLQLLLWNEECRVQSAECKRKRKEKEKEKRADDVSPALSESLSVSYPMGTPCERHTNARTVSGCSPPKIAENMINLIM